MNYCFVGKETQFTSKHRKTTNEITDCDDHTGVKLAPLTKDQACHALCEGIAGRDGAVYGI